ncbi:MAG: phytanoyl-CoA dioxygenase family protein [bacterium]|nr:phytanoyl-CoA dioxygenase family protein [bacterium]
MSLLSEKDVKKFHKDGFLLIKNAFSDGEVGKIRSTIDDLTDSEDAKGNIIWPTGRSTRIFVGDVLGKKGLDWLILDDRIVATAKQLLGTEKIAYFGESSVQIGVASSRRGFHRDNTDRQNPKAPDWKEEGSSIIKMGVYLQDHKKYSGGLKVRVGSHLVSDFIDPNNYDVNNEEQGKGKNYNIPSKSGDIMVWSMRLAHSANFSRLKLLPNLCLSPRWETRVEKKLPFLLKSKPPISRIAAWVAWGAPGPITQRYVDYYVKRGDFIDHWKKSKYNEGLAQTTSEKGIQITRPIPEYGSLYTD